jgi:hypothetical protein
MCGRWPRKAAGLPYDAAAREKIIKGTLIL